jgi:beta-lactamase family protein
VRAPDDRLLRLAAAAAAAIAVACAAPEAATGVDGVARARALGGGAGLVTPAGIRAAQRFARTRSGLVAFAVVGTETPVRGLRTTRRFPSASVVKAMLLVAELRRAARHALPAATRARLEPMIRVSDNDAAVASYGVVGRAGLRAVARAAGMARFGIPTTLFDAQVTAADQARFFLGVDAIVPARHRAYARALLASIVASRRWGIPPVADAHRALVFFKGGWRKGLTHQVALLERDGSRLGLAVLSMGGPSMAYRIATIRGIAARVLADAPGAVR